MSPGIEGPLLRRPIRPAVNIACYLDAASQVYYSASRPGPKDPSGLIFLSRLFFFPLSCPCKRFFVAFRFGLFLLLSESLP